MCFADIHLRLRTSSGIDVLLKCSDVSSWQQHQRERQQRQTVRV
jgi:hypothetical protein